MEEQTTDTILNSLAEGVFTVDKNFKINFFNAAAEKVTGLDRKDVIGKFCKQVLKSELCYLNCPIASILENGKSIFDLETQIQRSDGKVVQIRMNAAVLKNSSNEPTGGIISFRDMSAYKELRQYLEHNTQFYGIVGYSKPMQEIFSLITEISNTDATILIIGETGTGKELIANAVYLTSKRKNNKFVKVNCAVLPPQLLASELFGHSKGAFTDAVKERMGRFEYAEGGTIFLDEIAEIPIQMQLQLLRIIQEGAFERLGESQTRKVDVRIIAATNVNIEEAIKKGTFREDLFYRLNVIPIEVPPLRKRREDIPHLVNHFIKKFALLYSKEITQIDDKGMDLLYKYDWHGNVRELENAIEYAVIRSKSSDILCACSLPVYLRNDIKCSKEKNHTSDPSSSEILRLLELHQWNRSKVAKELNINRSTLWRKLKSMGIE